MSDKQPATLYFGYGSNLWLAQMARRCPTSVYRGIARLPAYRWIINSRGYANVVHTSPADYVYGLVFALQSEDEASLDVNEGVPFAYEKAYLAVDIWFTLDAQTPIDPHSTSEIKRDVLVYIDHQRTQDDAPRAEYVHRMNYGIADALRLGMPREYVEDVIRNFIPAEGDDNESVVELARKQALNFDDER